MGKRQIEVEKPTASNPSTSNNQTYDSSDEEDLRNTIGNIPVEWYDDVDHFGYNIHGHKIPKANGSKKDEIDTFLSKMEDPDYWRSVFDRQVGADTKLTDEQIGKIQAISSNRYPQIGYNPYTEFLDIYSSQTEIHPISNRPEDKRSFIPSADERRLVGRLVHAIKMGWVTQPKKDDKPKVYDLWGSESDATKSKSELARLKMHWPAPKVALPSHAESYNPPSEYLYDDAELKKWEDTEPEKRKLNFIPQKYDSLRKVPAYDRFYNERFDRCLDLYLAPRQQKMKLNIDPSQLLPDLPNPQDLRPFPTTLAFYMRGHTGQVRSISIEPEKGELLASGSEDSTVRVWYLPTGRCLRTFNMNAPVTCVAYCPDPQKTLILVSSESNTIKILNAQCGDKLNISSTKDYINSLEINQNNRIVWKRTHESLEIELNDKIRQVVWHKKGDYFASVSMVSDSETVYIHQLSKCSSQKPFSKKKGQIQCVLFHPTQPLFFVATLQHIRIYDLAKLQLKKKLFTGSRWVSCMQLDNYGNNLFIGGLDKVFSWIDMELSTKPWKSLKNHSAAIRSLSFHRRYPLLATASDDGTAIIYHAKIPQDLMKENELIPVKRLFGHASREKKKKSEDKSPLTILSVAFHPTQPWLITAGADNLIGLFTY